jgi:hypothetical protein
MSITDVAAPAAPTTTSPSTNKGRKLARRYIDVRTLPVIRTRAELSRLTGWHPVTLLEDERAGLLPPLPIPIEVALEYARTRKHKPRRQAPRVRGRFAKSA